MWKFILLSIVLILPLASAFPNFGYEQAKVFLFVLLTSFVALLYLWQFKKHEFKFSLLDKVALFFILILGVTAGLGVDPRVSFLGSFPYFQGWIFYAYLYLFYLLVKQSKLSVEKWALVLTTSATLVAVLAIKDWVMINYFQIDLPTYAGRVVSSFGQPNFYSGFLLFCLPWTFLLFKQHQKGWLILPGLILLVGILLSGGR